MAARPASRAAPPQRRSPANPTRSLLPLLQWATVCDPVRTQTFGFHFWKGWVGWGTRKGKSTCIAPFPQHFRTSHFNFSPPGEVYSTMDHRNSFVSFRLVRSRDHTETFPPANFSISDWSVRFYSWRCLGGVGKGKDWVTQGAKGISKTGTALEDW